MIRIHKLKINLAGAAGYMIPSVTELPQGAGKVIKIAYQIDVNEISKQNLIVWYEEHVDLKKSLCKVNIHCYGTGEVVNPKHKHIETIVMDNGMVWHYYSSTEWT